MAEVKNKLAEQLRIKRRELKLTQVELAAKLGVSQEMVSMIESEVKPIPTTLLGPIRHFILTGKVPRKL